MSEIDYNDFDVVIDTTAIENEDEKSNSDFTVLPKGTYDIEVAKVEYKNYQPKPGKTTGITSPCKQIALGIVIDGGEAGRGWADENLFLHPKCMFKIVMLFKACGLIPDGYKGSLPWDQLKGAKCRAKVDVEQYHSTKYNDEREKNVIKAFVKPETPTPAAPASDNYEDVPW